MIDGQKIFQQLAKLRKCQGSRFCWIPPLKKREGEIPVGEARPPLGEAGRKDSSSMSDVLLTDEKDT
jgi:hypothetical protein